MNWLKRIRRPRDTVARWIALTTLLAMLISLALNGLFIKVGGVWARPSLIEIGLLEKAAVATRLIDAAAAAEKFGIGKEFAADYHADAEGTELNFNVLSEAVASFRHNDKLDSHWKKEIDADFEKRKRH